MFILNIVLIFELLHVHVGEIPQSVCKLLKTVCYKKERQKKKRMRSSQDPHESFMQLAEMLRPSHKGSDVLKTTLFKAKICTETKAFWSRDPVKTKMKKLEWGALKRQQP